MRFWKYVVFRWMDLVYLLFSPLLKPRYLIITQEFCSYTERMLFKLRKQGSNEVIIKTAAEISLDKHLVVSLSQEDAYCIGFMAGYEQSYWDRQVSPSTKTG